MNRRTPKLRALPRPALASCVLLTLLLSLSGGPAAGEAEDPCAFVTKWRIVGAAGDYHTLAEAETAMRALVSSDTASVLVLRGQGETTPGGDPSDAPPIPWPLLFQAE